NGIRVVRKRVHVDRGSGVNREERRDALLPEAADREDYPEGVGLPQEYLPGPGHRDSMQNERVPLGEAADRTNVPFSDRQLHLGDEPRHLREARMEERRGEGLAVASSVCLNARTTATTIPICRSSPASCVA